MSNRAKKSFALLAALAVWAGVSILARTACWFQAVLGLPCPGCGTSRAAGALLRGDFPGAFAWHPLVLVSLAMLPAAAGLAVFHKKTKTESFKKQGRAVLWVLLGLYAGVFAVRMFLYFPHTPPFVPNENALWRLPLRWAGLL